MRVGIPTEVKPDENRVAVTPSGVAAFCAHGHDVVVQAGAGRGSAIPDAAYEQAGATIAEAAAEVWNRGDLILKVKEPLEPEFELMRPGQVLFTYLHLAASEEADRAVARAAHCGHRLRDSAARERYVAAAGADVRGGRAAVGPGWCHIARDGRWRQRAATAGRVRRAAGKGHDHRRGDRRAERLCRRGRLWGRRDHRRHQPTAAGLRARHRAGARDHADVERGEHPRAPSEKRTWSSARC